MSVAHSQKKWRKEEEEDMEEEKEEEKKEWQLEAEVIEQ